MENAQKEAAATKVIWPVDAYQCDEAMLQRMAQGLKLFFGSQLPTVQPVYILTPCATTLPFRWFANVMPSLRDEAQTRLRSLLANCPFPATEAEILVDPSTHSHEIVNLLNTYAQKVGSELVVIPTHAHDDLARFVL